MLLHDLFGVELTDLEAQYLQVEMVFGWCSLEVEILEWALRDAVYGGGGLIHRRSDYIPAKR